MIPVVTSKVFFDNSDPVVPFKIVFSLTLIPVIPAFTVITSKVFFANSDPGDPGDHFKTFGRTFFDYNSTLVRIANVRIELSSESKTLCCKAFELCGLVG